MCCSSLNTYEVFCCVTLRTVRRFPIHVFVRIIPWQKENRRKSWPVCSPQGDIRHAKDFSAARSTDILRRSYLISEQSPASSHSAPLNRRLIMILQTLSQVNRKFHFLRRNFEETPFSFSSFPVGGTFDVKTPGRSHSPDLNFCESFLFQRVFLPVFRRLPPKLPVVLPQFPERFMEIHVVVGHLRHASGDVGAVIRHPLQIGEQV